MRVGAKSILRFVALVLACSPDDPAGGFGSGSVAFTTYGEAYIEKEIPAADVEDGWTITFDKFLIVLRDVTVRDASGNVAGQMTGSKLFDMKAAGEKAVVSFANVPARAFEHVSFQIGPVAQDTEVSEGASDADKALMLGANLSVHVEGKATKGADTKTFKWSFAEPTRYEDCEGERDGKSTKGVVVTNGGTDSVQITIHGDHFFYDDLQADSAKVRFGNIAAADKDANGEVSLDELAQVKLVDLTDGTYGTGSRSDVDDLRAFVAALSQTLGHFRGEGECHARKP